MGSEDVPLAQKSDADGLFKLMDANVTETGGGFQTISSDNARNSFGPRYLRKIPQNNVIRR